MNDYCYGIAYATGSIIKEKSERYLVVRNCDSWYTDCIAEATGYTMYQSGYHEAHRMAEQWIVKVRNIKSLPSLSGIQNVSDFCRAYIELHGVLDTSKRKNNKKGLRLRIYGKEDVIHFINHVLPATEKKIQYVQNQIEDKYIGRTCAIYYQSSTEIENILDFLDGVPRNERVWEQWKQVIQSI